MTAFHSPQGIRPDRIAQAPELLRWLEQALRFPLRESQILVLTLPGPTAPVERLLSDSPDLPMFWDDGRGDACAGKGAALRIQARGPRRLKILDARLKEASQRIVNLRHPATAGPEPRFFGGLSFAPANRLRLNIGAHTMMTHITQRPSLRRRPEPILEPAPALAATFEPEALLTDSEEEILQAAFKNLLPTRADLQPHLRAVIDDVLSHPGSLVRARLAFAIQCRQGVPASAAAELAIGTEYFHTASLIFDDLPAMDDAKERRGHTCPHHLHGEAATILGALALINRGYALVWRNVVHLPGDRRQKATELVEACLGVDGVLDGQARDLHFASGPRGPGEVLEIAEGKTVSLIRLTLLLPAIIAGASSQEQDLLDPLSRVWGLAYQILDDFKDHLMSRQESGKSNQRDALLGRPNFPTEAGAKRAWSHVQILLTSSRNLLQDLISIDPTWHLLQHVQDILENDQHHLQQLSSEP